MKEIETNMYGITLGELLHEVCIELSDGQELLEEMSENKEIQAENRENSEDQAVLAYEFAEDQIRMRMESYRRLGDLVDEVICLYSQLQEDLYGDMQIGDYDAEDWGNRDEDFFFDTVDLTEDEEDLQGHSVVEKEMHMKDKAKHKKDKKDKKKKKKNKKK